MNCGTAGKYRAIVGESPVWHGGESRLYYVDIRAKLLVRYDPATGDEETFDTPELIGCLAARAGGGVFAAMQTAIFVFLPGKGRFEIAVPTPFVPDTHRFNDGTSDLSGRFLAGTMRLAKPARAPDGVLYQFEMGVEPKPIMDGFWTINGLAVSADARHLFVSDSAPEIRTIWRCDYDAESGRIGRREVFVDMHDHQGRPDGACTDREGGYWIAATDAGAVLRFDNEGRVTDRISIGTPKPGKPAFGGPDMSDLFITSLSFGVENDAAAGHLFCSPTRYHGIAAPYWR